MSTNTTSDVAEESPDANGSEELPGLRSRRNHPAARRVYEWARIILVAAILAIGVRSYAFQTFFVPSGSMLPTLQIGDRIIVNRLPWVRDNIHRDDIVVFRRTPGDTDPSRPADLVKRVIGLPGETISSKGLTIYINGRAMPEPWLPNFNAQPSNDLCSQSAFDIKTTVIPKGDYFVMGDCRGNSLDSRSWGFVPASYIVGKVFVTIWRNGHPFLHWY